MHEDDWYSNSSRAKGLFCVCLLTAMDTRDLFWKLYQNKNKVSRRVTFVNVLYLCMKTYVYAQFCNIPS